MKAAKEEATALANEVAGAIFEAQAANLEREKEQKLQRSTSYAVKGIRNC